MEINPAEHTGTSLRRLGREPMAAVHLHVSEDLYHTLRRLAFDSATSMNRLVMTSARRHMGAEGATPTRPAAGTKRRMHCYMPESMYATVRRDAYTRGVSVNRLICSWLSDDYRSDE